MSALVHTELLLLGGVPFCDQQNRTLQALAISTLPSSLLCLPVWSSVQSQFPLIRERTAPHFNRSTLFRLGLALLGADVVQASLSLKKQQKKQKQLCGAGGPRHTAPARQPPAKGKPMNCNDLLRCYLDLLSFKLSLRLPKAS